MLSQDIGIAKNTSNAQNYVGHLIPAHECIQPPREERLTREPPAYTQRKTNLLLAASHPLNSGHSNIVYFWIATPRPATGDADLVFTRQVVELGVAHQHLSDPEHQG